MRITNNDNEPDPCTRDTTLATLVIHQQTPTTIIKSCVLLSSNCVGMEGKRQPLVNICLQP
jgi:hypothetical protein